MLRNPGYLAGPGRKYNFGDYRYGFNGKENDSNGEFSSLTHYDYGFRIYNPAVGRFLSVDPLTRSYPWYTPYQFAGNKPIWAIDLDGLEEKYMITEQGKLTKPVISFMKSAFNFSEEGLSEVTWYADADYKSEWRSRHPFAPGPIRREDSFDRLIQRFSVTQAFNSFAGAITIAPDEVVYKNNLKSSSDNYWLSLIGHEQSHVEDYLKLGQIGFYLDYAADNVELGYRGAFTESLAYQRGDALMNWIGTNSKFLDAISNPFSISNERLSQLAISEGKRFRYEAGIDAEINFQVYRAQYILDSMDAINNSDMPNKEAALDVFQNYLNNVRGHITDLQVEKQRLANELDSEGRN